MAYAGMNNETIESFCVLLTVNAMNCFRCWFCAMMVDTSSLSSNTTQSDHHAIWLGVRVVPPPVQAIRKCENSPKTRPTPHAGMETQNPKRFFTCLRGLLTTLGTNKFYCSYCVMNIDTSTLSRNTAIRSSYKLVLGGKWELFCLQYRHLGNERTAPTQYR